MNNTHDDSWAHQDELFPIGNKVVRSKIESTAWARIYMSGPIEIAKHVLRELCMEKPLCVTIEPTLFIYTGGEEFGYVVGLIQFPRFPATKSSINVRAIQIARMLLARTFQHSALVMTPEKTVWLTTREDK